MRVFHCNYCDKLVFFENTQCLWCGHALAFLPEKFSMNSLEPSELGSWKAHQESPDGTLYRLCKNYTEHNVCNWAVPIDSESEYCFSCQFTRKTHELKTDQDREFWYKMEVSKRRLLYSLMTLGCPLESKLQNAEQGLTFEFLADPAEGPPVMTGHAQGVITLNIAEADEVERKRRQLELREPYRTLLGHFRHESGHYYWDRLIKDSERIDAYRQLFGDERQSYEQALKKHYQQPAAMNWQDSFVSQYASAHPWEDWAETWAHYLHMTDTLETALASGMSLKPRHRNEPSLKPTAAIAPQNARFEKLIDRWLPLTYALNNLNRGMGMPDPYPFVLSTKVIEKLKFIHETIQWHAEQVTKSLAGQPGAAFWKRIFTEKQGLYR